MSIARSTTRKRSVPVGQLLLLPFGDDDEQPAATETAVAVLDAPSPDNGTPDEWQVAEDPPPAPPSAVYAPVEETPLTAGTDPFRLDFTITSPLDLTEGGSRTRIEANLEAIRLLKRIESERRWATAEEQRTLTRYVGWGATDLARVVGAAEPDDPRDRSARAELQALLPEAEFLSLRDTILNAHYSYVLVPCALWRLVQHLGFTGGRILEPSVGVGHFFGTMPEDLRANSQKYAVEIDYVSAAIARQLYQTAHVQTCGFETARFPPAYFDLAIGNVPFGHYGVADPSFQSPERAPLARSIHNYFFARALDLVRPGGVVAFVTSRYTMDGTNPHVRQYLARQADFLGAVRLPRSAFALAGTEVVADILVFRRRAPDAPESHVADWIDTQDQQLSPKDQPWTRIAFPVNRYFVEHPSQIVGTPFADGRLHGRQTYTVDLTDAQCLDGALTSALEAIPANSYIPRGAATRDVPAVIVDDANAKSGEFHVDASGHVYTTATGVRQLLNVSGTAKSRIKHFVALRDAYRVVLSAMLDRRDAAHITRCQQALKRAYDAFVRAHGPLNATSNRRALNDDPESARIFALEDVEWRERRKGAPRHPIVKSLADIFTKITVSAPQPPAHAATSRDALVHSLAWKGCVDLPYMAQLRGVHESVILAELADTELFVDPLTENWTTRDDFLSGDVLSKLEAAQARAALSPAKWQAAVSALEAVQPQRIEPEDIDIRLGSAWVPLDVYRDFVASQLDVPADDVRVQFVNTESLSRWNFSPVSYTARARASSYELNVAERNFFDLINDAANIARPEVRKPVPGSDDTVPDPETTGALRESIRQVDERFREWWREEPSRAIKLADLYNRTFNRTVLRSFDGSHLTLPGSNPEIALRPHQRAVIWRVLQTGNTLIAHCVGAGKTFALIGAALEKRRLGLARKPLIAVPNHLLEQWRRDILLLYPAAKVLVPLPSDLDGAASRQRFLGRIAGGDWDVVLLTHSAFERIPVSRATFQQFIDEQVAQLEACLLEEEDRKSAKQIQLSIKRLQEKLVKRTKQWEKDRVLTFEELGVDMLLIDEAHLYKNLFFATKLTRIAGLSQSESDRAIDMFLKARLINKRTQSRGLVFATGTPICNAVSELYTMQRFLAMEQLETLGLGNFDNWKQQFADVIELSEPAPEGGYRTRARLRQYSNVSELIVLFRQFADVLTADDLKLPVPQVKGGRPTVVVTEPPPEFDSFLESLRERVHKVRTRQVDPSEDNMLKITGQAAAAAIDLRLINPFAPDDPNGRLGQAAQQIARIYHDNDWRQGTQLVFLDLGTPRANELSPLCLDDLSVALDAEQDDPDTADDDPGLEPTHASRNLYEDVRQKLIDRGVPAAHIAFIHQAKTDADKKRLYEAVNTGRIRILLCSTGKGGVGMNVQKRLVALHHLDVPWRPVDLEQRDGRIIRQGNIFFAQDPTFEVQIFRYVTARSFDEYRWGLLSVKQGFISQLLRGRLGQRTFEDHDVSQLSFEEASAAASGDPRTIQLLDSRQVLARLEAKFTLHSRRASKARSMLWQYRDSEKAYRTLAKRLPEFARALDAWDGRISTASGILSIRETHDRAALRDAALSIAKRAVEAANPWEEAEHEIGRLGSVYSLVLRVLPRQVDEESRRFRRNVIFELAPNDAWADLKSLVGHQAPYWDILIDPMTPPDFVRSFDTRWKSSGWVIERAASFSSRAEEAAEALAREEALVGRPFPHQELLDITRAQVRELEQALKAPSAAA